MAEHHIAKGDLVEDFELPDETGTMRKLSDLLAGGPVVLFFYPAAMTKGCTMESCHFRDLAKEFADVGAVRVGISRDSVSKQSRFADKHGFGYPLLSDPDGRVAAPVRCAPLGRARAARHQADDVRHRHRPPDPRGDPQRGQHGRARRSRPRGPQGTHRGLALMRAP